MHKHFRYFIFLVFFFANNSFAKEFTNDENLNNTDSETIIIDVHIRIDQNNKMSVSLPNGLGTQTSNTGSEIGIEDVEDVSGTEIPAGQKAMLRIDVQNFSDQQHNLVLYYQKSFDAPKENPVNNALTPVIIPPVNPNNDTSKPDMYTWTLRSDRFSSDIYPVLLDEIGQLISFNDIGQYTFRLEVHAQQNSYKSARNGSIALATYSTPIQIIDDKQFGSTPPQLDHIIDVHIHKDFLHNNYRVTLPNGFPKNVFEGDIAALRVTLYNYNSRDSLELWYAREYSKIPIQNTLKPVVVPPANPNDDPNHPDIIFDEIVVLLDQPENLIHLEKSMDEPFIFRLELYFNAEEVDKFEIDFKIMSPTGSPGAEIAEIKVYPNPFISTLFFEWEIKEKQSVVDLKIYDESGNMVGHLIQNEIFYQGTHRYSPDIRSMKMGASSDIHHSYYYAFTVDGQSFSGTIMRE